MIRKEKLRHLISGVASSISGRYFIATCLLLSSSAAFGQEDVWNSLKEKFPQEPIVVVQRAEVLTLSIDGDSLRAASSNFEDILHLKEQTTTYSSRKVYGSHFTQIEDLKAKTLVWDKNRYKEIPVSKFSKNSDQSAGIFYDDSYHYAFDFPAVGLRNRTVLEYEEHHKDPKFISGFMFGSYMPQAQVTYTIKAPVDVDLSFKIVNDTDGKIHFNKTTKGKNVVYEWRAENLKPLKIDDESPDIRYFAPHVVCFVKSYKAKGRTINVLSSDKDLYQWYSGFIKGLDVPASKELQEIVSDIKARSQSELELVKNVMYWVQSNIKYIAFEQGMRGLVPHSGNYVCEKRYGDCKDMASIIVSMLRVANVKAYHTWIGTRHLPYRYTEYPTPIVDNHMIATYIAQDGTYYFLDATSSYNTFGFPSSMIQGKEALIGKNDSEFEIVTVPVIDAALNLVADSISVKIDSDITGSGTFTLSGFPKTFASYHFDRAVEEDVRKSVVRYVEKGSNKFYLDKYKIRSLLNRDSALVVDYDFTIKDYHQQIGDEMYVNLHFSKPLYNNTINATLRTSPREVEYLYHSVDYVAFEIPKGYKVAYLPENSSVENDIMSFKISYEEKDGKIILSKSLREKKLMLHPSDFEEWNAVIRKLSAAYKESVILEKN